MSYDKIKYSRQDNKQLGRKAVRLVQLNLRFCILLSLLVITVLLFVLLNRALHRQPKHLTLHQYVRNIFNDPYRLPLTKHPQNDSNEENFILDDDEFDLFWSEEIVELFQDQLGIIINDDKKDFKCRIGEEFIVSALPGLDNENLNDALWQYVSLIALESQTVEIEGPQRLSLKAFVTEQMKVVLNELFEGIQFKTLSNLPATCYDLKYAQIIGNMSPIKLKEMVPKTTPLLLDPKAKRVKEIAQLFSSKTRPYFRIKEELMKEVQQEFLVTKTIQEVESSRELEINFVGVYLAADDKLPIEYYQSAMAFHRKNERTIFMFICDVESLIFCEESFDGKDAVGDARILRKSIDTFDFALMSSCNSTIVSNEMGVLHALMNGGVTTVYKPEATNDPEYYVPWVISEQMANFYAID